MIIIVLQLNVLEQILSFPLTRLSAVGVAPDLAPYLICLGSLSSPFKYDGSQKIFVPTYYQMVFEYQDRFNVFVSNFVYTKITGFIKNNMYTYRCPEGS